MGDVKGNGHGSSHDQARQAVENTLDDGVRRVVERARANGTVRDLYGEVTVRRVDPATLRRDPPPRPSQFAPRAAGDRPVSATGAVATRECARDGCSETFDATDARRRYCSKRCTEAQSRGRQNVRKLDEPIECARDGCSEMFVRKSPRQKYHSDECRDAAARTANGATKQSQRADERLQRAGEAASGGQPASATTGGGADRPVRAPAMAERFVELLFKLCEEPGTDPAVKIDALGRLERIAGAPPPR